MKKKSYADSPHGNGSYLEHQSVDQETYSQAQTQSYSRKSMTKLDKALIALSTALVIALVSVVAQWMIQQINSADTHRNAEADAIEIVALENPVPLSRSDSDTENPEALVKADKPKKVDLSKDIEVRIPRTTENFPDRMKRISDKRLSLYANELKAFTIDETVSTSAVALLNQTPATEAQVEAAETRRAFATVQTVAPASTAYVEPTPTTEAYVYEPTETWTIPETTPTFEVETEPTETYYEPTDYAVVTEDYTSETEFVTEESTYETVPEETTGEIPTEPSTTPEVSTMPEVTTESTTTPEPTTVTEPTSPAVVTDEMELFYQVIAAEAAPWWGHDGKTMIAEVIVNRVNAGMNGGTLYGVLTAPGQFSVLDGGYHLTVNVTDGDRAAAHRALSGASPILPTNTLYFCTDYAYAASSWFQSLTLVTTYENVYFMAP